MDEVRLLSCPTEDNVLDQMRYIMVNWKSPEAPKLVVLASAARNTGNERFLESHITRDPVRLEENSLADGNLDNIILNPPRAGFVKIYIAPGGHDSSVIKATSINWET